MTSLMSQLRVRLALLLPHVVIVHVAPGYANDPGDPGTGTIVAVLC